jgi:ferredoxin, 2Fe-2S
VGERTEMERSMLEFAEGVETNSRLACQIKVAQNLDGLIVRLPEAQH